MADERIDIALVGLGRAGQQWLRAISGEPRCRLVGVCDRDPKKLSAAAELVGERCFDDYRMLVAECRPQAVLVALPPFSAVEFIRFAAGRGCHVLTEVPFGRDLPEVAAIVQAFRAEQAFHAAVRWRASAHYLAVKQWLAEAGPVVFCESRNYLTPDRPLGWRGDARRAGGGALLYAAYEHVDFIVNVLGLPDAVSMVLGRLRPPRAAEPYDVEDTAVALLRYPECLCTVQASWVAGPPERYLALHGCEEHVVIDEGGSRRLGPAGTDDFRRAVDCDRLCSEILREFLDAIAQQKTSMLDAREQLATMAVIESAYLATRTEQPHAPARLLHLHKIKTPFTR